MASESNEPQAQDLVRLHAVVRGRVQGVNFRYFTLRTAQQLGLTGWVANRRNGTVEVVAEGSRQALRRLVSFLQHGPPAAAVQRVDDQWTAATREFDAFQVRFV